MRRLGWMWLGATACGIGSPEADPSLHAGAEALGLGSDVSSTNDPNAVRQTAPWKDFVLGVLPGTLCGLTVEGAIDCPLADLRGIEVPEGAFDSVVITGGAEAAGCALDEQGEVVCFDARAGSGLVTEVPEGRFKALAGHSFIDAHACAVEEGGTVVCWGEGIESGPPDETFGPVLSGWHDTWCGLLEDQTIGCWASTGAGSREVLERIPEGRWDTVSVGDHYACAMRGTAIVCWGDVPGDDPPDEELRAVGTGESNTCGVRLDGTGVCWGSNGWGQLDVPDGAFAKVLPGREQVCGLRTSGDLECWGFGL